MLLSDHNILCLRFPALKVQDTLLQFNAASDTTEVVVGHLLLPLVPCSTLCSPAPLHPDCCLISAPWLWACNDGAATLCSPAPLRPACLLTSSPWLWACSYAASPQPAGLPGRPTAPAGSAGISDATIPHCRKPRMCVSHVK